MSSQLEDLREANSVRKKLGPAFVYADLETIMKDAHDLREIDGVSFGEALDIASGKTRLADGSTFIKQLG